MPTKADSIDQPKAQKKIAVVAPFPNPHFLEIFDTPNFTEHWDVERFCFRSLPAHRLSFGWSEAEYHPLTTSYLKLGESQRKLNGFSTVVYYGAIDPWVIPGFLLRNSLRKGQKTFLVTEGLRYKHARLKSMCSKFLMNHSELTVLAIGDRCKEDFHAIGITKPKFLKFGFFENYEPVAPVPVKSDSDCTLLSVGQLIDRKNVLAVVNSLQRISEKIKPGINVKYIVCGDGAQKEMLIDQAAKSPGNISIQFLGNQTALELKEHFSAADFFVMPSKYDGWGVVMNQAIHNNLPILASTGVRAARDNLVRDGSNGFLFSNDDELDRHLLRLINEKDLLHRFRESSRQLNEIWNIDSVASVLAKAIGGDFENSVACDSPLGVL